jgi:hypothetical protein
MAFHEAPSTKLGNLQLLLSISNFGNTGDFGNFSRRVPSLTFGIKTKN